MSDIIQKTRSYREKMWASEPNEIQAALTENKGTEGSLFFSALYAVDDTKHLTHSLYTFRKALRQDNLDLKTVKQIMKSFLDYYIPWMGWLKLNGTEMFLKDISGDMMAIGSRDEFIGFTEELILYIGRLNQWLDAGMPWFELVQTYDSTVKK